MQKNPTLSKGVRILKRARHEYRHLITSLAPSRLPQIATASSKVERILGLVQQEFRQLGPSDFDRKRYLVGLLHLACTYMDDMEPQARRPVVQKIATLLRDIYDSVGDGLLTEPTNSRVPLAYFVSYPRSGNTLITQLTAIATQAQILTAVRGGGIPPFSKKIYDEVYPYPRIVKDHVARDHYANDKCVFIVRDGRDTVVSLAYMTYRQGLHNFKMREEIADFIYWCRDTYPYGDWPQHIKTVLRLTKNGQKKIVRYEDFLKDANVFVDVLDFYDPDNRFTDDFKTSVYKSQDIIFQNIKKNTSANKSWGIGHEFDKNEMYYDWSLNRKGSSWMLSWDSRAKKAFHELGGTEALMGLGYETDENWWKQ